MKNIFRLLLFCGATAACTPAMSQLSEGGFPLPEAESSLKSAPAIPTIVMPPFSVAGEAASMPKCGNKFAHKFRTSISIKEQGIKTTIGSANVWKVGIKSEGAYSLNLIFSDFLLPEGARLFIYSPGKEQLLGAFTQKNNTTHKFATAPVDGDQVIVEYEEPASTSRPAFPTIESVNHDYRNLKTLPNYGGHEHLCEVEAATGEVFLGKASDCLLLIDGDILCSGNLINNTAEDANPYIVSAGHCFWTRNSRGQEVLDTTLAHTTVAFFNYEAPSANWPIEGSREMSLSGATTVACRKSNDALLIRMDQVPPADYRTYYAGWNRETSIKGPVHAFHHPQGDVKKYSFDAATPSTRSFGPGFASNAHWRIYRWDLGITESGSSGSGLFDHEDLLVGNLTGGDTASSCNRPGDDYYWKYCDVWDDLADQKQNLGFWLDPLGTGATTLGGRNPYTNPCRRLTNRTPLETPAVEYAAGNNFAVGTNQRGMKEFAERFSTKKPVTLYGVYFFPMIGYYNNQHPVYLRIYKGGDKPDSLVHEQRLKITTSQYTRYNGQFAEETTMNMAGMENYLRLSKPLQLDSTFFVSFAVPESGSRKIFALYYSEPRENATANTAFYLGADSTWLPFTQHPTIAAPTSLMADVVLKDGWEEDDTPQPVTPDAPTDPRDTFAYATDYLFYPTITSGELNFGIPKGDELKSIQIVDMNGRTLYRKDHIDAWGSYTLNTNSIGLPNNTYILLATYNNSTYTFRFTKWRTTY